MKRALALLFCFGMSSFAHAQHYAHTTNAASETPNVICMYFQSGQDWISEGGAIGYITDANNKISLASTSMNMTSPEGDNYAGLCVSQPIEIDAQNAIVKMAAYTTAKDFNMDQDCEVSNDTPYAIISHFKAPVGPGASAEVASASMKMINYFLTENEKTSWSQSGDIATAAANKKCLDLFPGSKPASP